MATLDWDGLVFYDQQIKKHIENKLVNAGDELDKILDKYASKTYVSDEIAKIDLTGYAKTADVDTKLANYVKKTDAFSGSYNDLTDKPTIPNVSNLAAKADLTAHTSDNSIHITSAERTKWNAKLDNTALNGYATETYVNKKVSDASLSGTVDLTGYAKTADVDTKLANYVKKTDAFSGSYNDLTDKPTIPNVTGKADKTYVDTELAKKANKSELFSGSYNDLNDKPDIANLATKVELNNHVSSTKHITDDERTKWNGYNDTINTMKTNFEDGVNTIYNAVVAKGITPLDKRPSSIVNAIERLILMISKGPLLTYTFETGSQMMPLLNGNSSYVNFCKDTDNGDGTITRKLYVETEVNKINKISFEKRTGKGIISLDNTANIKLTSTNSMFKSCEKLRYVNLSNLDTSNVTDMSMMFWGCRSLTSLDVSNFDTSKVTSMQETFRLCTSLTSLNVSNFNTSKVTNMSFMFNGCSSLTSLDVSNFNTSQVTNMSYMFNGCDSLTSLDVSNFNTSQVDNMRGIFYRCSGLTSLDVSNFDTSRVYEMENMFSECSHLTSLHISNFNTSQVYNMGYMFYNCNSLTSLDVSNFDTSQVTNMREIFGSCTSLTSLDIRNFSSSSLITYDGAFSKMQSTCTVYVDKTKFTKTETDCEFAGTFTDVSQQG